MSVVIKSGSTTLPSPDKLTTSNEIIWSANTGRNTSGLMIGDVVAEKTTFTITWGVLTKAQRNLIRNSLQSGFHPFTIIEDGDSTTIDSYRSTITYDTIGTAGSTTYYKDMQVSIIQQ